MKHETLGIVTHGVHLADKWQPAAVFFKFLESVLFLGYSTKRRFDQIRQKTLGKLSVLFSNK